MFSRSLSAIFIATVLVSCSDKTQSTVSPSIDDNNVLDLSSLVANQTGGGLDLATFLESGEEVTAIDVLDVASEEITQGSVLSQPFKSQKEPQVSSIDKEVPSPVSMNLSKKDGVDIRFDELSILNERKNETIASLTRLNEELILEIQRLRSGSLTTADPDSELDYLMPAKAGNQLQKLQNEIAMLKSNLLQKSHEIDGLRRQNDQFQNGIDSLQPRVSSSAHINASVYNNFNEPTMPESRTEVLRKTSGNAIPENCTLEFDAVVTLLNGKSKEIFYTEFFLISKSLPELLFEEGIYLKDFPQVSSFEELWAQSRKSPFVFPGIYKRIRNALLSQVEKGRGSRVRTDIDGVAEFQNLQAGSFYLVGTAPVGKTGAVWNLPVRLRLGVNKTSLTLANANWRE